MENGQLLLKFLNIEDDTWVDDNEEFLSTLTDKLLVLAPLSKRNNTRYLYFKTTKDVDIEKHRFIKINKNSGTNTLYTINGLNKTIERDFPGVMNHFECRVDWDKYKGVILLENKKLNKLKIVRTKLIDEIFLNETEGVQNEQK